VRHLAAGLREHSGEVAAGDARDAEAARIQLWRWLHEGGATLDDGRPIGFALFDDALQRANERLPRRGARAHENVTRAAWLLAELTHAPTLADAFIASAPVSPTASLPRLPADAATD
jgi:malate synthase